MLKVSISKYLAFGESGGNISKTQYFSSFNLTQFTHDNIRVFNMIKKYKPT